MMVCENRNIFLAAIFTISVCLLLQYWRTLLNNDYKTSDWNPTLTTFDSIAPKMKSESTTTRTSKVNRRSTKTKPSRPPNNKFIYLIQTESCLSHHLLHPGLFGDGCMRDVVVLSWKQPCTSKFSRRKHIRYIYRGSRTWGEGRNILYHFAKNISSEYLYYTFMDDDLKINFTDTSFKQRYRRRGIRWPLNAFEDFLLNYEPAIGVPMYCSACLTINKITGKPKRHCCDQMKTVKPVPEYLPVTIHFDAAFNSFHKNAIDLILPYRLDHERESWWQSQKFVILAADLMFRGQVLRFSPVMILNEVHREYPRLDWDNWGDIYKILKAEMPRKFRDKVDWMPDHSTIDVFPVVQNNTVFTPMWRIRIPSGKIIVTPFKHLYT